MEGTKGIAYEVFQNIWSTASVGCNITNYIFLIQKNVIQGTDIFPNVKDRLLRNSMQSQRI